MAELAEVPRLTVTSFPVELVKPSIIAVPVLVVRFVTKSAGLPVVVAPEGPTSPNSLIVMLERFVVRAAKPVTVTVLLPREQVTVFPVTAAVSPVVEHPVQGSVLYPTIQPELKVMLMDPPRGIIWGSVKVTSWEMFTPSGPRTLIEVGDTVRLVMTPWVVVGPAAKPFAKQEVPIPDDTFGVPAPNRILGVVMPRGAVRPAIVIVPVTAFAAGNTS